jgi:hypothetical protein
MEQQEQEETTPVVQHSLIGCEVQPKIPFKRLKSKIELENGEEDSVCQDFIENGGTIKEVNDKQLMIEVATGVFYIHRMYVERN